MTTAPFAAFLVARYKSGYAATTRAADRGEAGRIGLPGAKAGHELIFVPGPQAAEGHGVYFSEGQHRPSAPDAIHTGGKSITGILVIDEPSSRNGWYRAKSSAKSTLKGARTWHTQGRSIRVRIDSVDGLFYNATIVAFY